MSNPIAISGRRGFTLIELMVTMAIAVTLIGLAARSLNHGSASLQLRAAADSVVAIVAQARQMAATTNVTHELRICQWQEGLDHRVGLFIYRAATVDEAQFTGERHLCDPSTRVWPTLSPLLSEATTSSSVHPPIGGGPFIDCRCATLRIHPSGRMDLPAPLAGTGTTHLSLTTEPELMRKAGPRHFVTVEIHSASGMAHLLRPGI